MKVTIGLFVGFLIISSSLSLPASNRNDENTDLNRYNNSENSPQIDVNTNSEDVQGVANESVGDSNKFFPVNPFSFLEYFQDNVRQLRERIEKKIWTQAELEDNEDVPSIEESKRNATSVVEIIDGHKIEINETVYSNANIEGHTGFKVRVIQVRPLDLDENLENESTTIDHESYSDGLADDLVDQPIENEINKTVISPENFQLHNHSSELTDDDTEDILAQSSLGTHGMKFFIKLFDSQYYDLLNETNLYNINETANEDENVPIKADGIILFNSDENLEDSSPTYIISNNTNYLPEYSRESLDNESNEDDRHDNVNSEWETLEDYDNELNNDIEMYSPVEIDLSNDTIINDILADQGAAHDPEAEVFSDDIINYNPNSSRTDNIVSGDTLTNPNFSSTTIK